jgi:hypothetical protein
MYTSQSVGKLLSETSPSDEQGKSATISIVYTPSSSDVNRVASCTIQIGTGSI